MKVDLNKPQVLERLFTRNNTDNANYFDVSVRAVQKAKSSQKFIEYKRIRTAETLDVLDNAFNLAVNRLISLLDSENERIVLDTAKTLVGAYQGLKTDTPDNFAYVDSVIVSIRKCAEREVTNDNRTNTDIQQS